MRKIFRNCSLLVNKYWHSSFSMFLRILISVGPKESVLRQTCIPTILNASCKTVNEQNMLCNVGASNILGILLGCCNVIF